MSAWYRLLPAVWFASKPTAGSTTISIVAYLWVLHCRPLLGAIALKPLDDAMEKLGVFYVRYVDDWCILAKSKFKLRHAIKKMHRVLEKLQMKTHPDKTFIGRREKSFSFLGFQFCNQVLMISNASFENHEAKRLQLQEQQALTQRLVDYGRRWLRWFTAGVTLASGYAESIRLACT